MEDKLYFDRDEKGNLIPIEYEIDTRNELILKEIEIYNTLEDNDLNKKIISLLEENYNQSGKIMKIKIIPILSYEHKLMRNDNVGLDGKPTQDQEADLISRKLIEPKLTFEQARDLSDYQFKNKVIQKIYEISYPKLQNNDATKKKINQLLQEKSLL